MKTKDQIEEHFRNCSGYMSSCLIRLNNPNGSIFDKKASLTVTLEELESIKNKLDELFKALRR